MHCPVDDPSLQASLARLACRPPLCCRTLDAAVARVPVAQAEDAVFFSGRSVRGIGRYVVRYYQFPTDLLPVAPLVLHPHFDETVVKKEYAR